MVAGEQHKTNPVTIVTTTLTICFAFSRDVSEHWLIVYLEFSATWAWTGLWSKKLLLRRRTLPLKQKAQHEDNCLSKSFVSTPIHSSVFNRLETKESWKGQGTCSYPSREDEVERTQLWVDKWKTNWKNISSIRGYRSTADRTMFSIDTRQETYWMNNITLQKTGLVHQKPEPTVHLCDFWRKN